MITYFSVPSDVKFLTERAVFEKLGFFFEESPHFLTVSIPDDWTLGKGGAIMDTHGYLRGTMSNAALFLNPRFKITNHCSCAALRDLKDGHIIRKINKVDVAKGESIHKILERTLHEYLGNCGYTVTESCDVFDPTQFWD